MLIFKYQVFITNLIHLMFLFIYFIPQFNFTIIIFNQLIFINLIVFIISINLILICIHFTIKYINLRFISVLNLINEFINQYYLNFIFTIQ